MPGRNPSEAYFELIDPIQKALNFIVVGRLSLGRDTRGIRPDTVEVVTLNDGDPAPLHSPLAGTLLLSASLRVIVHRVDVGPTSYHCQVVGYWYTLYTADEREVIAYHWTPDVRGNQRDFPHLHIGSVIAASGRVAGAAFNKFHIPTGVVPVAAFVRFAIEELGVGVRPGLDRRAALAQLNRWAANG
jgi:hypothetical protein